MALGAGRDLTDDVALGVADFGRVVRGRHHTAVGDRRVDERHLEGRNEELALPIGRIGEKGRPVDRTRIRKLTLRRRQVEVRCRPDPEAFRVVGELRASDLQTDLREVDVLRETEAVGHVEEAMGM